MQHAFLQAFEDFLNSDGERAIEEATEHRADGRGLWVILFDDGRYALEHATLGQEPARPGERPSIAFPVEPLSPEEHDARHPEDSRFSRAVDSLWQRFRQALAGLTG